MIHLNDKVDLIHTHGEIHINTHTNIPVNIPTSVHTESLVSQIVDFTLTSEFVSVSRMNWSISEQGEETACLTGLSVR